MRGQGCRKDLDPFKLQQEMICRAGLHVEFGQIYAYLVLPGQLWKSSIQ